MKKIHTLYIPLFSLLLLLFAVPALAQESVSDNEVNEVAKGLYCPVCESTPLDVCPTQACADWRELIRTKLANGESKADIETYFALQYGDGVLASPPREGVNLILWLFPVVAIVLGGLYFGRLIQGLKVGEETAVTPPIATPVSNNHTAAEVKRPLDHYIAAIEKELEQ